MQPVPYDHVPTHEELTALLQSWADDRPDLVTMEAIGHSHEGRPIWMLTVTELATGPAADKPAVLVDANIHAAELTSSTAALHLLHRLLTGHGSDEGVTRALRTRAFHVVPRINPDGAERVLRDGGYLRSSVRPHPFTDPLPGLRQRDVDGDGRVLFMRYPDPTGPWTTSRHDPRLLVRRAPDDDGRDAFRLLLEGDIVDHDGATVPVAPPLEGIDLAMNLPADWGAEATAPTRFGPHPTSEPEIRALVEAVEQRPNIVMYVSCHTFGGLLLHPPLNDTDDLPAADGQAFADLGTLGQQLTGYRPMSMHDLKFAEGQHFRGGQFGWFYDHLGILAWITEFWSPQAAAGIEVEHPSSWLLDHPEADDLALLAWNDRELDGRGFVDWYSFDHPQLGPVELGGWDLVNVFYNPPLDRVEGEVAPHSDWVVSLALSTAELTVTSFEAEPLAPGVHHLRLVLANAGWLPTHGSRKALERGTAGTLHVELELEDGAELRAGALHTDLGQLEGRVEARTSTTWWGQPGGTPNLALVEWVVGATTPTRVSVRARHPRAGSVAAELVL